MAQACSCRDSCRMLMGMLTQHLLSWLDPDLHHLNIDEHKAVDWVLASANFKRGKKKNKPKLNINGHFFSSNGHFFSSNTFLADC